MADYTADGLIQRWFLNNAKPSKRAGQYLWHAVMLAFGVGSTRAREVCQYYRHDPDLRVRKMWR